jgi:hypothetical protein
LRRSNAAAKAQRTRSKREESKKSGPTPLAILFLLRAAFAFFPSSRLYSQSDGAKPLRLIGLDWLRSTSRSSSFFGGFRFAHSMHVVTSGNACSLPGEIGRPHRTHAFPMAFCVVFMAHSESDTDDKDSLRDVVLLDSNHLPVAGAVVDAAAEWAGGA